MHSPSTDFNSFQRLGRNRFNSNRLETQKFYKFQKAMESGSGPGGRRFKSSLPDQFFSTTSRIAGNSRTSKRTYIRVAGTGWARNSRHTVAAAMLTASTLSSHHVRL